jgi:hypothetical protein
MQDRLPSTPNVGGCLALTFSVTQVELFDPIAHAHARINGSIGPLGWRRRRNRGRDQAMKRLDIRRR